MKVYYETPYYHDASIALNHSASLDGIRVLCERSDSAIQFLMNNCAKVTNDLFEGKRDWDGAKWSILVVEDWDVGDDWE